MVFYPLLPLFLTRVLGGRDVAGRHRGLKAPAAS
jgi:hypothetical protein